MALRTRRSTRQSLSAACNAFTKLIAQSGADIHWLPDVDDGLSDSIFTRDPSIITYAGAVILNMGKALRKTEPALHKAALEALGVPLIGAIKEPGTVEGGDTIWLDDKTLVVGRGIRTNQDGIEQLDAILKPHGISVISFDLPLWDGEDACLHLMSMISPLADDLISGSCAAAAGGALSVDDGASHQADHRADR